MNLSELQNTLQKHKVSDFNITIVMVNDIPQFSVLCKSEIGMSSITAGDLELAVTGIFDAAILNIDNEILALESKIDVLNQKKAELANEPK